MPRTDFVTKPWHGHQCGFHHPKRLLAYPRLHLSSFLPEAHLHQCPPIVALLTALTYL